MFETLMLRLTTNVTVSPPARAELVGGGAHLLDHLGAALGEQRGELLGGQRGALARHARSPAAPRRRATLTSPRRPEPAPRDERPVVVLITSSTPCAIHSGSMYSGYTHRRSDSAKPSAGQQLA
jgi:hypothetical protein